jgi:hypothetical protein
MRFFCTIVVRFKFLLLPPRAPGKASYSRSEKSARNLVIRQGAAILLVSKYAVELYLPGAEIDDNVRQFFPLAAAVEQDSASPHISSPIEFEPTRMNRCLEKPWTLNPGYVSESSSGSLMIGFPRPAGSAGKQGEQNNRNSQNKQNRQNKPEHSFRLSFKMDHH